MLSRWFLEPKQIEWLKVRRRQPPQDIFTLHFSDNGIFSFLWSSQRRKWYFVGKLLWINWRWIECKAFCELRSPTGGRLCEDRWLQGLKLSFACLGMKTSRDSFKTWRFAETLFANKFFFFYVSFIKVLKNFLEFLRKFSVFRSFENMKI